MQKIQETILLDQAIRKMNTGHVQEAYKLCHQVLASNPREAKALALLGQIGSMLGRFDKAIECLKKSVSIAPNELDYQVLLAELYTTVGKDREAMQRYEKVLKRSPTYPSAVAGKANTLARNKDYDGAMAVLKPFVESGTEDAGMAVVYARAARHFKLYDRALATLNRHVDEPMRHEFRRMILFEIANILDKTGDVDGAFAAYVEANRAAPKRWNPDESKRRHEHLAEIFTPELLAKLPRGTADPKPNPIFIVGMPRSGSTLVEQILSSHPDVFGAGEVLFFQDLVLEMNLRIESILPYPECVADLEPADVATLSEDYLAQLRELAPRFAHVTDKYLSNYEHLGLIALLFPGARVIHTTRHPLDTCLSCFVQKFTAAGPAFTEDLVHLGGQYVNYQRLMRHWHDVLDLDIMDLAYEDMVRDQEGMTRRLLEYCRLPWNDQCLRYYDSKRKVLTLSHEQVDKPIYTSSIQRFRKYEKHLDPLKQALREGGVDFETSVA